MNRDFSDEFVLDADLIHVNHAAVGPWPVRTQQAVCEFAEENSRQGSLSYLHWIERETSLRRQLQQLIHADSIEEIALLKSTSEALSVVAYGVDWNQGDSVVSTAEEFPSNRVVWQSLASQGVTARLVEYGQQDDAEQAIIDACDETTRLVSVSAVQFASGRLMDLERLGVFCQQNNILFCVDAIQQIGALDFDVNKIHADFVAADGHKWMLGPEGLALFYCRKNRQQSLKLNQFGWHMVEHMHDFDRQLWEPAHSARRFECGSPNMTGTMALSASLSLIHEVGIKNIERQVLDNTNFLLDTLSGLKDVLILSSADEQRRSGILTFKHRQIENTNLFEYLKSHHVFCAPRGGGIRLSPHFYTPREKLLQLVAFIDQYK